jgi:hypothetical protein
MVELNIMGVEYDKFMEITAIVDILIILSRKRLNKMFPFNMRSYVAKFNPEFNMDLLFFTT